MNENYKNSLETIIKESKLSYAQKELWQLFFKVARGSEIKAVFEAVKSDKNNLVILTTHLRDQIWNLKRTQNDTWKKIIKNEKKFAKILS